jgi:tellurite resistance protein
VSLLRFLGVSDVGKQERERGDTETIRRIAAKLERIEPVTAKRLAGFAYVLARVANADLEIDAAETAEMERSVRALASLSESEAALVVQIAKTQANVLGDTENYIVTREYRRLATREQRAELLQCVYAVAAADGTISGDERAVIGAIAEELGFTRAEANALRAEYRDKLSELRSS